MKRREFIINSCNACLSVSALAVFISSCTIAQSITGKLNDDGLLLDASEFQVNKQGKTTYLPYVVVRHESLKFPICVYRFSDTEYSALWMQCAHQGAEVQVMGTHLQCPAHGSEYNNRGMVTNGPATSDLRTFPVTINNNQLFIDLRKK